MYYDIHTYIPTYPPTYLPTYIHTYLPTHRPTYLPTYIHTYSYIHMCSCVRSILYLPRWRSSKRKTQMELLDLPILGTPSVRGFGNANPGGANGHESQLHGADSSGFLVVRGCKGKHGMHMLQLGHSRSSTMFHMFFSNSLCPGLLDS